MRLVWDYNIQIAEESARDGFDEIQFDYVRFPDALGLQFSVSNTEASRVKAVIGFLREAKEHLKQIRAAEEFVSNGWMLWNPGNVDSPSSDGLRKEKPSV